PAAAAWASFLETAQDAGQGVYDLLPNLGKNPDGAKQPFGFAIKFVTGADACGRDETPALPAGNPALGPVRGA
ncbi:hypothetical protein, partial [Sinorhizobium meliloti]|uniref:hypothetical protein n=1 Tax=Rhizobium meliloti TaxID=382 RepID=UPI0018659C8C